MWRRALKVMAISYGIKTVLVLVLWVAAPDLVRQARGKALDVWASFKGTATPAAAAIAPAAPHRAAGAVLRPVSATGDARPVSAVLR